MYFLHILEISVYNYSILKQVIRKYAGFKVKIFTFNQSRYPRIDRDSLTPIAKRCNSVEDMEAWYPPGHGDFYLSFCNSGLLDQFLLEGREYCFISNVDNLGATVDLNILNLLLNPGTGRKAEFVMEVTDKTKADVKGGTLMQYENHLRLLEIARKLKSVCCFQNSHSVLISVSIICFNRSSKRSY